MRSTSHVSQREFARGIALVLDGTAYTRECIGACWINKCILSPPSPPSLSLSFSLSLALAVPFLLHTLDCIVVQHDRDRKALFIMHPARRSVRALWQIHVNIYSEKLACTLTATLTETLNETWTLTRQSIYVVMNSMRAVFIKHNFTNEKERSDVWQYSALLTINIAILSRHKRYTGIFFANL